MSSNADVVREALHLLSDHPLQARRDRMHTALAALAEMERESKAIAFLRHEYEMARNHYEYKGGLRAGGPRIAPSCFKLLKRTFTDCPEVETAPQAERRIVAILEGMRKEYSAKEWYGCSEIFAKTIARIQGGDDA